MSGKKIQRYYKDKYSKAAEKSDKYRLKARERLGTKLAYDITTNNAPRDPDLIGPRDPPITAVSFTFPAKKKENIPSLTRKLTRDKSIIKSIAKAEKQTKKASYYLHKGMNYDDYDEDEDDQYRAIEYTRQLRAEKQAKKAEKKLNASIKTKNVREGVRYSEAEHDPLDEVNATVNFNRAQARREAARRMPPPPVPKFPKGRSNIESRT